MEEKNMWVFLGISVILLGILLYGLFVYKKTKQKLNITFEQYKTKYKTELTQQNSNLLRELDKTKDEIIREETRLTERKKAITDLLDELESRRQAEIQHKEEIIEQSISNYFESEVEAYRQATKEDIETILGEAIDAHNAQMKELEDRKSIARTALAEIESQLSDWQMRRDAINADIQRQKQLEEKADYYRICLSDKAKEDISRLLSIVDSFNNKETIYKLIWSEYIQQPFKTLLNHVLGNRDPRNVIYMIQNIKTKETYIGKTKAEVSKRWTEHIKTSLNIGTISRTLIHKALFNDWDNYSFAILEEVSADANLNEREKYYIDFYQTNVYGYNIKSGG